MSGTQPYAEFKYLEVNGSRMAYIDEGEGDAIVFQHGQPTSSYVWRNVMPHLKGLGRLVACDLIGMGASDKLDPSLGPDRYSLANHRDHLFKLWDYLDLGDRVLLVLDDWGAVLGFEWARTHSHRVQGIVHMEAVAVPLQWSDLPEQAHPFFKALRSSAGEKMVLEDNVFIEKILPGAVIRPLADEELNHYRHPFLERGEARRPTLSWPRSLPLDNEPADVAQVVGESAAWLADCEIPKLFINGEPGTLARGRVREIIRTWRNQTEVTVAGRKLLQEDSPHEIGTAIAEFANRLRG
ncbi:haloalkane dehalogenase 3 [Burkholderia cenocepacia]|uniref:Haloalkane dehalogenase 3 n=1 Tax=Burkholderia cenocepacia TaxID=95486 RepID=A0AAN0RPV9_9BURK|nr:haloalkane dehalogenase 3 [Burkholderia cenocepacia]